MNIPMASEEAEEVIRSAVNHIEDGDIDRAKQLVEDVVPRYGELNIVKIARAVLL